MTDTNVDLVRRGYAAFSRGDAATLSEVIAADAVQHVPGASRLAGAYKGLEAVLGYYGQLAEQTDGTFAVDLLHVTSDGHGHVMTTHRATARRQGRELDQIGGIFFTVAGGQVRDLVQCDSDIEALDAFFA